ncbi:MULTISPECIES: DUF1684 domain-containing protein [unclassified Lentimicrobium]|uniref:DUF1684 domain-containing protein n=1 Tax=unclassified Lentimicrobium TaxID=2677434 RepID=UPI001555AF42|nr:MULTISPECIES: DUF1684 domain-containing protein [unclassified Lentimicrobium]NPD45694.1 DUF1684 domain-containing protein [Lentimicrobium sp. S6]NPD85573.1 DUF1684 domain-containing protein [Lentimicrobium sp. L6]
MKNLIFSMLVLISSISCQPNRQAYKDEIIKDRLSKDSTFRVIDKSPLSSDQIDHFIGLEYFEIDEKYMVEAHLEYEDTGAIIKLKTSTDRLPDYKVFGNVVFELDGKKFRLKAYQNINHQKDSLYKDFLFLPFTDDNSTVLTYGGGRYIDFKIPETKTFIVDFNKAYNPYCAYNHRWSCVIPPRENSLPIAINAGEKKYPDVH